MPMKEGTWKHRYTMHHADKGGTEYAEISIYGFEGSDKHDAEVTPFRGDMSTIPADFVGKLDPYDRKYFTATDYAMLKQMLADFYGPNARFEG